MSISTELTRLAQNVGALNADTNAIFEALRAKGVDVPADAQLSDVADMIESIVIPLPTEITIGEHTYPVIKVGNRLWTAKGLYEKESESAGAIPIERGSSTKLDKETYGLMYHGWNMFSILSDIVPTGWRFPNRNDLIDLMSTFPDYVQPNQNANGSSICSTEYWENPGTNETGFGLIPINQSGYITGWYGNVISSQTDSSGYNYYLSFGSPTGGAISTVYAPGRYFGVRLCSDIP